MKCSKFLFLLSTVASVGTLTAATSAGAATLSEPSVAHPAEHHHYGGSDDSRRQLHRGERPDLFEPTDLLPGRGGGNPHQPVGH